MNPILYAHLQEQSEAAAEQLIHETRKVLRLHMRAGRSLAEAVAEARSMHADAAREEYGADKETADTWLREFFAPVLECAVVLEKARLATQPARSARLRAKLVKTDAGRQYLANMEEILVVSAQRHAETEQLLVTTAQLLCAKEKLRREEGGAK